MLDTPEMAAISTVDHLEDLLSKPTGAVVDLMRRLEGDLILLGAGGKIGPSLARMAKRASDAAGVSRRIIAVSRFSNGDDAAALHAHGVETIRCDLMDESAIASLPEIPNAIYLAGLKFGSSTRAATTWAINTYLPGVICRRFRRSRIVAYSTGAVYGLTDVSGGGSTEDDPLEPIGEYAASCVGRERIMEYFSRQWDVPIAVIRLFYACELRYGVLVDIARKVAARTPIDVSMGCFNIIWQGDNNAATLLALEHATTPPTVFNLTGPEILSIREVAEAMGRRLGVQPEFRGEEQETSCLGNASQAHRIFGRPSVRADQLIQWVADWVRIGGQSLNKPTHYEVRNGRY